MKLLHGINQLWKNRIKNSDHLGNWYLFFGSLFVRFLQLFFRPNEKQIMFISYSGRQYSDSPKELYLKIKDDPRFSEFKLIWALNNPGKFKTIPDENKVSANKISFFVHLIRSKYWVANSSIDRLLAFKHPQNVYIQFWHGIPLKHLGRDEKKLSRLVKKWYANVEFDYFFSYGDYDEEIFARIFPKTKTFIQKGSLRFELTERQRPDTERYKKKLGLDLNKPTLLYVPTFREYKPSLASGFSEAYLQHLSKEYNVLYRGHYFKSNDSHDFVTSVDNESLFKLYWIADYLVTDYSSAFFEFLPFGRPIFFFVPDLMEYQSRRGLYLNQAELGLPIARSEYEFERQLYKSEDKVDVIRRLESEYLPAADQRLSSEFIIESIFLDSGVTLVK